MKCQQPLAKLTTTSQSLGADDSSSSSASAATSSNKDAVLSLEAIPVPSFACNCRRFFGVVFWPSWCSVGLNTKKEFGIQLASKLMRFSQSSELVIGFVEIIVGQV